MGLLTPTSMPARSMERVREDTVSDGAFVMRLFWKGQIWVFKNSLPNENDNTALFVYFLGIFCLPEALHHRGDSSKASPAAFPDSDRAIPSAQEKGPELCQLL